MTTSKKAAQCNYTVDQVAAIVGEYKQGREDGLLNNEIMADLSAKFGKSIPSIRAKLASLKVYTKDLGTSDKDTTKAKKSDIVEGLEALAGLKLTSLEACNKIELQALADYIDDLKATIHDLKARI